MEFLDRRLWECGVMVEMPSEGKLSLKMSRRAGFGGMVIALDL